MIKRLLVLLVLLSQTLGIQAQSVDSTQNLKEVNIHGYQRPQKILTATQGISKLDSATLENQPKSNLVSALNTIPGVRMEERSPGSYRLSVRGSLLRSPFGIRNVKIYLNDFALTDAGGNTYLNLVPANAIKSIEIEKGPQASLYGANTGGALLLDVFPGGDNLESETEAGSYGLFIQSLTFSKTSKQNQFGVLANYQRNDGYRENSKLSKKYLQLTDKWKYNRKGEIKFISFYSEVAYQTPGGLTMAQLEQNPRAARFATATLPGAKEQQAAIDNKTLYAGLSHKYTFNEHWQHFVALNANYTDFSNPFITNYEKRYESNIALRTLINYQQAWSNGLLNVQLGLESGKSGAEVANFENIQGVQGNPQTRDELGAAQNFGFINTEALFFNRFKVEAGISANTYSYVYEQQFPIASPKNRRSLNMSLMPKFALAYLLSKNVTWRLSVAKGFSPPTIAEIRASDQQINTNLRAEEGCNYETGLRWLLANQKIYMDGNVYYFNLRDAIVRRLTAGDAEYFVNAGETRQLGFELEGRWRFLEKAVGLLRKATISEGFNYQHYKFGEYADQTNNYANNRITGVPTHIAVSGIRLDFARQFYLYLQHNYTGKIPLNDANTAIAKAYHLVDIKTGVANIAFGKSKANIYVGLNNLLNEHYSLGNDLNAVGGRFYNVAPAINFFGGLRIQLM